MTVAVEEPSQPEAAVDQALRRPAARPLRAVAGSPMALLALITLLGAILRLVSLDRPSLWGDEAFTFSRICGSYRQMLGILQTDGFMPLHYSLYWWIGQHWDLSPVVMRLPVAIAGIFMPPAMYFLARQMRLTAQTALLIALFTACSAYMLTYSRDAKMYMPFWMFATAHVGCLLWWLNAVGRARPTPAVPPAHFRYFCWLATGAAMVGFHRLGLGVLGVEALMFLCWLVRRWAWSLRSMLTPAAMILSFALGGAMLYGATWAHNRYFSQFDERAADEWHTTGLGWVPLYNAERDGWEHLKFTATAFAFSWEWPNRSKVPGVDPRAMKLLSTAAVLLGLAAVVGTLPWRKQRADGSRRTPADPVAPPRPAGDRSNWPRSLFFILVWLLLPTYAVYCRSIQPFASPWAIVGDSANWLRGFGWQGAIVMSAAGVFSIWRMAPTWRGRATACGWFLIVLASVFGVICAEYLFLQNRWDVARQAGDRWPNIWMPRYLGFVWPAFAIALCVLLLRLPTRPIRWGAIAVLIGVNLVQFSVRVWGGSEPRTDLLTADIARTQPMHVRGQQLTADIYRQTWAMLTGQPTRLSRLREQVEKLPLNEPDTRVYVQTGAWSPEPGGGVIGSFAARYYLVWRVGIETFPREFRRFRNVVDRQWVIPLGLSPRPIASDLNGPKHAKIRRLIAWDRIDPGARDPNRDDPLGKALSPAWQRVADDRFTARDHWTWRHLYTLRRREYVRVRDYAPPAPATRPATAPATTRPTTTQASR